MTNSTNFICGRYQLDLAQAHVMGIVNVTPDSFSDGGRYASTELAVAHARKLVTEGAAILDIGGESTRPNATPVSLDEELSRVIPVIERLAAEVDVPLSIDTYKPAVMREAVNAGAAIINDIRALQEPGAIDAAAAGNAGICLMHMQGTPQTMQLEPHYDDVVQEVKRFLLKRLQTLQQAGIAAERIVLDPGFGFGKRTVHNIALLEALPELLSLGRPLLVGLSRKSILGQIVGSDVDQRLHASLAASVISAMKGASIVRVHDVKATVDALKVVNAVLTHG
ncbi:dihydropteroate synthase [Methylobacillus gramineus]|uniref:dihydropteroate synthase n=1 Tax=Methylobacillus gramineus TaxID=755169 RepID=UPI001CFF59F2|nr:dihydropteroate synthase [Methylobacillus gramineus]MCB5184874.1 dihydropteroate synthase [Methylobacillus gramineus]